MNHQTEKDFLKAVVEMANLFGWQVAHFRPGLNRRGQWQTAVAADGAGFPDLVMVNENRFHALFVELKVNGDLSAEQYEWIHNLQMAGEKAYVWTPDDWTEIEEALK